MKKLKKVILYTLVTIVGFALFVMLVQSLSDRGNEMVDEISCDEQEVYDFISSRIQGELIGSRPAPMLDFEIERSINNQWVVRGSTTKDAFEHYVVAKCICKEGVLHLDHLYISDSDDPRGSE